MLLLLLLLLRLRPLLFLFLLLFFYSLCLSLSLFFSWQCNNKLNYRFEKDNAKNCESFATSEKRCEKEDSKKGYKPVSYFCPFQCNTACSGGWSRDVCENVKNYQLNGKNCTQLATAGKCKIILNGPFSPFLTSSTIRVEFFCPEQCKRGCHTRILVSRNLLCWTVGQDIIFFAK